VDKFPPNPNFVKPDSLCWVFCNASVLEKIRDSFVDDLKQAEKSRTVPEVLSDRSEREHLCLMLGLNAMVMYQGALEEADEAVEHRDFCADILNESIFAFQPICDRIERLKRALTAQAYSFDQYRKAIAEIVRDTFAMDENCRRLVTPLSDAVTASKKKPLH